MDGNFVFKTPNAPKYDISLNVVNDEDESPADETCPAPRSAKAHSVGGNNWHDDSSSTSVLPHDTSSNTPSVTRQPRQSSIFSAGPSGLAYHRNNVASSSSTPLRTPTTRKDTTGTCPTSGARSSTACSSSTTATSSCYIIAIVEGRGAARGETGIACIDLKNPVLALYQFADTETHIRLITQLNVTYPTEILLPNTAAEVGQRSNLFQIVSKEFPEATPVTVKRKYFNETRGLQYVKDLCIPENKTIELEVMRKYYCLAACAALIKYIEFIQNVTYARDSLKIVFKALQATAMIDSTTAAKLEIARNELNPKSSDTLFGVLKKTRTPGGSRLLRANLLQPSTDLKTIEMRLECVTELIGNQDLFECLRVLMGRFVDIEPILAHCVALPKEENIRTAEQKISNAVCLKHTLDLIEPLRKVLEKSTNTLFRAYFEGLQDARFIEMKEKISLIVHSDARCQKGALNTRIQKCFAVKPNINGLLDIARRTYTELVDDITEMMEQMSQQYNLPLRLGYGATRGFYIQIYKKSVGNVELPPVFLKVTKFKNVITCVSKDLIRYNDRIRESVNEIYIMSNAILGELFKEIRGDIGCLYKLTEVVATLDFLVSLAHYSSVNQCVKPQFGRTLALKNSRHPILERTRSSPVVPNNVFISNEINFIVITGPNMSGKTTYLKQVALMQIMAQIGSYIPAEFASFRVADQIFSKLGCNDSIEMNCSTFTLEMKEASYILANMTDRSLIIMDELASGTSVDEGEPTAWAIAEEIIKTKAFTLFTTHFRRLPLLEATYLNAANYHFSVEYNIEEAQETCNVEYTYSLKPGHYKEKDYGIRLAELCFPASVVAEAKQLAAQIHAAENVTAVLESEEFLKRRKVIQVVTHLAQLAQNPTFDEADLRIHLQMLQQQLRGSPNETDNGSSELNLQAVEAHIISD